MYIWKGNKNDTVLEARKQLDECKLLGRFEKAEFWASSIKGSKATWYMQQSPPKTQDSVDQVSLGELWVTVMRQTAELFESPLWETTGLPGPSPTLWSWTGTFLSRWQTRCLFCSWSEIEGVSATVAGRGTIMKTGELNESSRTKYWDSHHSMAHPTPLSDTVSLNNGCGTMPSRQDVKSTFSGQPRDFWAVCSHKEFPKETHCQIILLWSPQSTHPTHAHSFQTGLCECVSSS